MANIENPTLRWPVRLANQQLASVASDSPEAIQESVARIGALELGEITVAPFLGLPAIEFAPTDVGLADYVKQTLETQEPDAAVNVLRLPEPGSGWEQLRVEVSSASGATDVR